MGNFDYESKAKEFVEKFNVLDADGNVKKQRVSILVHKNPDGDTLGSGLALSLWLQKSGHEVKILAPNRYPEVFASLPNSMNILIFNSPLFHDATLNYLNSSDSIICVDFGQKKRLDDAFAEAVFDLKKPFFTFDHHLDPVEIEGYVCSNTSAASTCEIVYELLKSLNPNCIDDEIAQCLYTGILTDTSRFMTANMTPRVHEIAAELLTYPSIVVDKMYKNLFGSFRYSRMKLLGHLLCHCMRTIKDYKVAYLFLSLEDSKRYKIFPGDTDGIVNYALSVKNVILGAMFKEKEDGVYISFRSIGEFSVNDFSAKHFNGGGHRNAAGGSSKLSLEKTIEKFENVIKEYEELKHVEQ